MTYVLTWMAVQSTHGSVKGERDGSGGQNRNGRASHIEGGTVRIQKGQSLGVVAVLAESGGHDGRRRPPEAATAAAAAFACSLTYGAIQYAVGNQALFGMKVFVVICSHHSIAEKLIVVVF